jgi:hypothetical protein
MTVSKNEALEEPDRAERAEQTSSDALGQYFALNSFSR